MSRIHSHINTAISLLKKYPAGQPFAGYARKFFSTEKKYGSKDRKAITQYCYHYFRTSLLWKEISEQTIARSYFLCSTVDNGTVETYLPEMAPHIAEPAAAKAGLLGIDIREVFPYTNLLSEEVEADAFIQSFLQQPDLFLRVRPGKNSTVETALNQAGIEFIKENDQALRLKNAAGLDDKLALNKDVVVQDLSSQQVFDTVPAALEQKEKYSVWDCCAASGGKSILLHDVLGKKLDLTVTDIRQPILDELKKRLSTANIPISVMQVLDLQKTMPDHFTSRFDVVICDAPCTGSGTWARTPEQLASFRPKQVQQYAEKQKNIALHALYGVKPGGVFIYITCSVFGAENEPIAAEIGHRLELVDQRYIKGYDRGADTMFVAVYRKPLA